MSKKMPVDLTSSPASSRSSSTATRRTRHSIQTMSLGPQNQPTKSRMRSTLASAVNSEDEEKAPRIHSLLSKTKVYVKTSTAMPNTISRASMSSVSTMNEYGSNSGYSTPGTSAVATPVVAGKEEKPSSGPRPRGRPRKSVPLAPAALEALERARNLRTSEYSLNPQSNKRKRFYMDDEEDEDNDDSDNSPDAQLARTLQNEENRKVNNMDEDVEEFTPKQTRRAQRVLRPILPKADYVVDLSDNDFEAITGSGGEISATSTKLTKLPVSGGKKFKLSIADSEESEFIVSDSEDELVPLKNGSDSEVPFAFSTPARKRAQVQSVRQTQNVVIHSSNNFPGRQTSRGRGASRGRPRLNVGGGDSRTASAATNSAAPSTIEGDDDLDISDLLMYSDSDSNIASEIASDRLRNLETSDPLMARVLRGEISWREMKAEKRAATERTRLECHHPELLTMWEDLKNLPQITANKAEQPTNISRELKPFQLEGLSWMQAMEKTDWGGGLLGDEMGMGKTIQAVSLIMSDYPARSPSLVLIPPVALMQWQQEIGDYTDGTLKTFVFHGTNKDTKGINVKDLKKYDVILMSYNSLESMFRHQEKGFKRKDTLHKQASVIHKIQFHRVILDEAHNIKTRTTGVAKACFALKADHKWCLSGTPLQNRIGEFFSLVRFLDIRPFACYFCKQCPCSPLEWSMDGDGRCKGCNHSGMQHVSVFNQELLNPIQKFGNKGLGKDAFAKLRLLTNRFMLRRIKRDHSSAMELPAKEIHVDRQFFSEVENDFAGSIMNSNQRKFDTYVAEGVLLNNYANIFGLIMQMRQVADHPDLILKKHGEGGQNILICCICDDPAEDAVRSSCRHDFCRSCVKNFITSADETNTEPDCPQCHIPLSIDLEQPEIEQDEQLFKKSSIINRIKMDKWTSSTKIESLVYQLHNLRSKNSSTKSIIFSQFTTMLQLVEWRLRRAGITTVMLDGSMTPAQRQGSINHFMTNVDCECFLVSLKAGGVALNLTEASHVFIVDPWWNPAAEWQSADRCHRIGQSRPCSITRLCIEDSVESRMVLLQEKKANMINSTINSDDAAMESLTPEDMQFLFRGN